MLENKQCGIIDIENDLIPIENQEIDQVVEII